MPMDEGPHCITNANFEYANLIIAIVLYYIHWYIQCAIVQANLHTVHVHYLGFDIFLGVVRVSVSSSSTKQAKANHVITMLIGL